MDKLEALQAFTAIADQGGFAAAARELRVSPQAVTRAIAGLESHLGIQLLHRTTRSVRLTDEGAVFLARSRQILAELRDAEQTVMGARTDPHGNLVVTAPVVFGRIHIVPVVANLLRRHGGLSVRLMLIDRTVRLVEEGIDIAVRIGELPDSSLRAVRVAQVRQILIASPAYLEKKGTPTRIEDLHRHELVLFPSAGTGDEWRFGPSQKQVLKVRPRLEVNSADAAIFAAEAGLGITRVLSYQVADAITAGRLHPILDAQEPPPLPVNLLFQAGRRDSASVRGFIDGVKDHLRGKPL